MQMILCADKGVIETRIELIVNFLQLLLPILNMTANVKRLQAAVQDGRAQTPRFKQQQLVKLQEALMNARSSLVDAICADTGYKVAEAEMQCYLTLSALKDHYCSLDFKKMLQEEFLVANSKDNTTRRNAFGCAYIIPTQYSLLYSSIVPVSAAIAAGNCILLEVRSAQSNTLATTNKGSSFHKLPQS
jgi:acyl-CoA reductase-like NAD-dependent aldehyde dehydrogenase